MGDIYAQSFITIAASKAEGPNAGCFNRTDKPYMWQNVPLHPSLLIRQIPRLPGTQLNNMGEDIWPHFKRAWVYQEMRISRRILHFGLQEVVWQCRRSSERESNSAFNTSWSNTWDQFVERKDIDLRNDVLDWHTIVREYTSRHLTFQRDRLPALAAIAKREHMRRAGDTYLAGLWRSSLLRDLLWTRIPEGWVKREGDPQTSEIPSWSWASIPDAVHWKKEYRHDIQELKLENTTVLGIQYQFVGSAYIGRIQEAAITIQAPLFRLSDWRSISDPELDVEHLRPAADEGKPTHTSDVDASLDHLPGTENHTENALGILHDRYEYRLDNPRYLNNGSPVEADLTRTFVLFTYLSEDASYFMSDEQALLLTCTGEERTFRRVGVLTLQLGHYYIPDTQAEVLGKSGEKLREVVESYTPRTITLV